MAQKGFNLLQPQGAPATFWDKSYAWVVGTARVIIIIVEIIVFGAFVSRFVLDRQTKDLDEQITVQQTKLTALKEREDYFRDIQGKATAYQEVWETSSDYADIITEINTYLPTITSEIGLQIKGDTLIIRGFADFQSVSALEASLKGSPTFERTEVFEVEEQGGNTVGEGRFAVRAIIRNYNSRVF